MIAKEKSIPAFLSGGGEMGTLIRSFDWSKTAIGSPDTWPQSLRMAIRIMLDTPFGMYIAWGKEYIQLYNDGYRPILGTTKHPQALGIGTRKTFTEIWPTIGPMFEGVMQGIPVGFPDFTVELDRNGYLEDCVFDFCYSPIRLEDGEVGGVLVTVIETTEKVKAAKALQEREQELQFAIEAAELGTWDLNPATNKFKGNARLKEWFGLKPHEEIELPLALAVIADEDREKVTAAIDMALQISSGGHYDITYTIIHPHTKNERVVRAKGRAFFDDEGIAYRFNGTLQDVTTEMAARRLLTESEQRLGSERTVLYNSFMNAPAAIAIFKGDTHIYEFANAEYERLVKREIIIGKTIQEHFPEIEQQGIIDILNNVFSTGEPFLANEFPVELINKKTGKGFLSYYNSAIQPIKDAKGNTERILSLGLEVTQHVEARKQIEASEEAMRQMASYLKLATDSANVGTWSFTVQTQELEWSNLHKKMWGYDEHRTDLTYEDWHKVILPGDKEKAFAKTEEARVNHTVYQAEYYIKRQNDGALRYMRSLGKYYYNDAGEAQTLTGISMDITEQKEAEGKLIESEVKFRVLSETIPHMIWTAATDGKRNFVNQYTLDYTGLSVEDLKGDGWQQTIFPEDLEQDVKKWHHALVTGEDLTAEKRIRRHDGSFRWHLCRSVAQKDNNGNIIGWIGTNTDITKQKNFTEELEKKVNERTGELIVRNAFIQTLIDSSIDLIIAFDKDLRYLSINKAAEKSFAQHFPEGVIGKRMDEVIPTVHQTGVYEKVLLALEGNIISQKEYLSFYEKKYYDVDFIPLRNETEIYGVMAISRDVTENVLASIALKRANAELEERKNFLEAVLETSKEYIAVYAKDLKLVTINKATEILMGKKREDVIGKTLFELMPQSKGSKEEADLRSAMEGNNIHNEAYQSAITGRYIETYVNPLKDAEGNVYAAVVMANDVTNTILKQKEIEAARELLQIQNQTFELAESIAQFGSYRWNVTSNEMEYSDNLYLLLGCEPKEFTPSFEKFLSFIHPDDLRQFIKNGEETLQTGRLVETPYRIVSKTGKIKHLRSSGSFTGEGNNRILIGTVQDISKDVEAAEELRTKNLELELTNAELTSFSYVASHDLQEPLRKIQSFGKLILQAATFEAKTQDYFNRMIAASERMQNLIVSLLDFSRTSETKLIFELCDLNAIVDESNDNLQVSILEKQAVIEYDSLPTINASQTQLLQLFTNLIDNAIKYSRPEIAPYIKITSSIAEGEKIDNPLASNQKEYHQIKVADNGIGFDKEYEHKIFELFQRLHGRSEYSGTGIGLAIVKKIVNNHSGFIEAEGSPGIGSTFTIYLPTA